MVHACAADLDEDYTEHEPAAGTSLAAHGGMRSLDYFDAAPSPRHRAASVEQLRHQVAGARPSSAIVSASASRSPTRVGESRWLAGTSERAPSPPTVPTPAVERPMSAATSGTRLVANAAWARFQWAQANRKRVNAEKLLKERNERARSEEHDELKGKVGLLRSASVGRVQASRDHLLECNKQHRREEGQREQFALAEKARRLAVLREEHRIAYLSKYKPLTRDWSNSEFRKHSAANETTTPTDILIAAAAPAGAVDGARDGAEATDAAAQQKQAAMALPSHSVPSSAIARCRWAQANRKLVEAEKQRKERNARARSDEKNEIHAKVGLLRSASVGRVQASRDHLLECNKQHRREEGQREQFALAEKARRLAVLQQEHQTALAASFRPATADWEASEFTRLHARLAPGGRLRRASGGKSTTSK